MFLAHLFSRRFRLFLCAQAVSSTALQLLVRRNASTSSRRRSGVACHVRGLPFQKTRCFELRSSARVAGEGLGQAGALAALVSPG